MYAVNQDPVTGFRQRLRQTERPMFGTFIKTPVAHTAEISGRLGFDFLVIDAEHAPFDRGSIEQALLGARAGGVAALVRVADRAPSRILAALDDGAAGIIAPHIATAQDARDLVAASRYSGRRGFSNSPRAGEYGGRSMWQHVDAADNQVAVVAMVEDPSAIDEIEAIVAVDGLDAVFIGRGDLAVALGERDPHAPQVRRATERVIEAAGHAGKAVLLMPANPTEAADLHALGVRGFVVSSDQGFLRTAATQALRAFSEACGHKP